MKSRAQALAPVLIALAGCGTSVVTPITPLGCATLVCDPHASCDDAGGTPTCRCASGYRDLRGDGTRCEDIDECALGTAGCDPHADCTNTDGGRTCTCTLGYTGDGLVCTDNLDCAMGATACGLDATCTDIGNGAMRCVCDPGFEGDGQVCTDVDGCLGAPCFPGVTCTDVAAPGTGFTCGPCPDGYEGDGVSCTDIDGCLGASCFPGVTCTDVAAPGTGSTCGPCPDGYEGDGRSCTDIDGCLGAPCFPGVTCTDVAAPGTGATCGPCPDGYEGDGRSCTDIDGCLGAPCFPGVTCTDVAAPGTGATCGPCPLGYEGDGVTCTDIDGCLGSPCFPGVTCTDVAAPGTGATCGPCPAGYEGDGRSCTDVDGCLGSPCFPGVTCTDVAAPGTGFTCGPCPVGYDGDGATCVPLVSCSGGPVACDVNATCTDLGGGDLRCVCSLGYAGDGGTCVAVTSVNLIVPIEMTQISLESPTTDLAFPQSYTPLDTSDYDGVTGYELDVVASNTDAVDRDVTIIDSHGTARATVTIPAATAALTRRYASFSPVAGADVYEIKLPGTTTAGQVRVSAARILVHQVGATRTRLYYPLMNGRQDSYTSSVSGSASVGSSPPEQAYPAYHAAFRKIASAYGDLAPVSPWTLEAVFSTASASCPAAVSLFNLKTGASVAGATLYTGNTSPTLVTKSFADAASNFTAGDDFGVKVGALSCGAAAIHKAGLWLRLVPLRRGEVCYRVSAEYHFLPPTTYGYYLHHRQAIDWAAFSNPVTSFQADMYGGGSSGTTNIALTDCGSADSGACSIVSAASLAATFSDYALVRSDAIGLTSGHRFAVAGTGDGYLRNACVLVDFAE